MKPFQLYFLAAVALLPLRADTILNTFPDGPAGHTGGDLLQAQTFIAPTDNILSSFEIQEVAAPGQSVQLEIFQWNASGPVGAALYTSAPQPRTVDQIFTFSSINLALTAGNLYGAVVDNLGFKDNDAAYNMNQNSYSAGGLWVTLDGIIWGNLPGDNVYFMADFVPSQTSTPEPSTFLLIGAGFGGMVLARRALLAR